MKLVNILIISGVVITVPLLAFTLHKKSEVQAYIRNINIFFKIIAISFLILLGLVLIREILMLSQQFSNLKILNYPITFLYFLIYLLICSAFLIDIWKVLRNVFNKNPITKYLMNVAFIAFILTITILFNILGGYGWKLTLINNESEKKEFILNIDNGKYIVPAKSTKTFYFNNTKVICESAFKKYV